MENANWHGDSEYHRTLNGFALIAEREKYGLNQWQLARECGWSPQFQSRLEGAKKAEVHISIIKKIEEVFKKFTIIYDRNSLQAKQL